MMMFGSENKLSYPVLLISIILASVVTTGAGYKHVVFVHGILAGPDEFGYFNSLVQEYHPGTPTTLVNAFNNAESLFNMWQQVKNISDIVRPILTNTSSEGTILVSFSQGGLISRALLATIPHNVHTWVSLSSPLAGQFGDSVYLKYLFPTLLKDNIYKLFYTKIGQDISIANYWNDPHQQDLYKEFSTFLALLNNESSVPNPKSRDFKENFLRLKNMVLVGGPDDGVITPWQSSQFGMYNSSEVVLPMEEQMWYKNDAFGLQTMKTRGSIVTHTFPGIHHVRWHAEQMVFDKCIKPWL